MNLEKFFQENEDWRPFAGIVVYPPLAEELTAEFKDVDPEVLIRCEEVVREGGGYVTRGAIYTRVRREERSSEPRGTCDKWAAMLALNAPPGVKTESTFWAGRKHFSEVFGTEYADNIRLQLAKKGINLKAGDEYMPELVRPEMGFGPHNPDPEAVVPAGEGRSYIKKVCEKRGWASHGAVETKHRMPDDHDPHNKIPMAEDLIRRNACNLVRKNPDLRKLTKGELRHMVLQKHGPSKTMPSATLRPQ